MLPNWRQKRMPRISSEQMISWHQQITNCIIGAERIHGPRAFFSKTYARSVWDTEKSRLVHPGARTHSPARAPHDPRRAPASSRAVRTSWARRMRVAKPRCATTGVLTSGCQRSRLRLAIKISCRVKHRSGHRTRMEARVTPSESPRRVRSRLTTTRRPIRKAWAPGQDLPNRLNNKNLCQN